MYDLASDTWAAAASPLPMPMYALRTVVIQPNAAGEGQAGEHILAFGKNSMRGGIFEESQV